MCNVFFDERPSDDLIALLHGSDVLIAVVSAR
jgi:hypothetical protein